MPSLITEVCSCMFHGLAVLYFSAVYQNTLCLSITLLEPPKAFVKEASTSLDFFLFNPQNHNKLIQVHVLVK